MKPSRLDIAFRRFLKEEEIGKKTVYWDQGAV